jgi:hypothetical protein
VHKDMHTIAFNQINTFVNIEVKFK